MRYSPYVFAAVLLVTALSTSRLVTAAAPVASGVTNAAPAAPATRVDPAPTPEYLPARFRDVKVWDERSLPATF